MAELAPEKTDEELAAEEVGGDEVVIIDHPTWRHIVAVPCLPVRLLEAAESGGKAAVIAVAASAGIRIPDPSG